MTDTIEHPLRLAIGSHRAGSGKGCVMNLISWENGDIVITDLPECADSFLAKMVQRINDKICDHRNSDLLCPSCSVKIFDLAHRIVGTGTYSMSPSTRCKIWATIARTEATSVENLDSNYSAKAHIYATEAEGIAIVYDATVPDSTDISSYYNPDPTAAVQAVTYAIAAGKYEPNDFGDSIMRAHRIIDQWCELAGFIPQSTAVEVTQCAIDKMLVKS